EASATGAAGAGAAGAGAAVLGSQATTQKVSEPGVAGGSGVAVDQAPVSAGGEQDGGQAPVADASGEAAHAAHAHSDASDAAHTAEHERSSADDAAAPVPAGYEATGVPGFAAPVPDEVRERVERERAAEEAAEAAGNREVSVNEARDAMGRDTHTEHRDEDVQDSEGEEELIVPAAQQSTSVPGTVPLAGTPEFEEMEREREAAESGPEAEERRQEAEQAERDRAETIEAGRRSAAEATGEDASHDEDEELIVPAGHQATDIPGTAPLAGTPEAEQLQAAGDGEQGATDARDSAPHDAAEDRDADHVDLDAEEVNFGTAQDDDAHIAEADIDYPQVSVVPIEDAEHAGTHSSADAAPAADSGDEWVAIEDGGADQAAAFQGDVRSAGATDAPQVDKLARAQEARWS
ncbi:MAG: hypothetical protein Q4G34_06380, partial [Micrococcus sp.]|nr:hypothetical protein [Micrococcus sp.]